MIYGYCRVSTKGQAKDGNSLEAQEKAILERYTDAKIYTEAYTGTTTNRPVFTEIIENLTENDMLVVAKLDRLARNTVEGIQIVQQIFAKMCIRDRAYAAKSMKIPYTSLLEWLKGLRGISQRNAGKIRNFLKGKYVIDVDTVVNYLLMQKEQEDFDLTEK